MDNSLVTDLGLICNKQFQVKIPIFQYNKSIFCNSFHSSVGGRIIRVKMLFHLNFIGKFCLEYVISVEKTYNTMLFKLNHNFFL